MNKKRRPLIYVYPAFLSGRDNFSHKLACYCAMLCMLLACTTSPPPNSNSAEKVMITKDPEAERVLVSPTANRYPEEYKYIIDKIRIRALRPVTFNTEDSYNTTLYLLHALDSKHVILSQTDAERIAQEVDESIFSETGYNKLLDIIDYFSSIEAQVLSRDVLPLLKAETRSSNHIAPASKAYDMWATSDNERKTRLKAMISDDKRLYQATAFSTEEVEIILTSYYSRQFSHTQSLSLPKRFELIANAVMELVDSNSRYFLNNSELYDSSVLSLSGLGIVLSEAAGAVKVDRLLAGGPAAKAGTVNVDDYIIGISQDGKEFLPTYQLSLEDAARLLRGKSGSPVHLALRRGNESLIVTLLRGKASLEEQRVSHQIKVAAKDDQTYRIGIINVPAFYVDFKAMRNGSHNYLASSKDVKSALDELLLQGVDGVVLDLRNNGGGSLQEGNLMTGLFIDQGPVIQIRHSDGRVFRDGKRTSGFHYSGPLVVLVNRRSAGSSEILAGAIQDYSAGLVIGQPTFGLGVVQAMTSTPLGSIKLTEAEYFRVSGRSYQIYGVTPDIELPSQGVSAPERFHQKFTRHPIQPSAIPAVNHADYMNVTNDLIKQLTKRYLERMGSSGNAATANDQKDHELGEALEIITDYIRLKLNNKR